MDTQSTIGEAAGKLLVIEIPRHARRVFSGFNRRLCNPGPLSWGRWSPCRRMNAVFAGHVQEFATHRRGICVGGQPAASRARVSRSARVVSVSGDTKTPSLLRGHDCLVEEIQAVSGPISRCVRRFSHA